MEIYLESIQRNYLLQCRQINTVLRIKEPDDYSRDSFCIFSQESESESEPTSRPKGVYTETQISFIRLKVEMKRFLVI